MGTFAWYTGEMNIEEEKRDCFAKQMIKLLNYGGMMGFEKVSLYGYDLYLLSPAELSQKGEAEFWYNYFEDSGWEKAGFNAKNSKFHSNKIGGCEFCDVILAAYMLCEMYDETPGFAEVNGDIVDAQFYGGWVNHILGTDFSMKKRYNLWENAEHIAFYDLECSEPFPRTQLRCLIPDYLLKAAGGTELSDLFYIIYGTESLEADQIIPSSYPKDVYECKKVLVSLREICGENFLEYLLQFLRMDRNTRGSVSDIKLAELAKLSLVLPARVFVYLAAEIENESFWKLWKEWKNKVYHDEQMKQYASEELQKQREEWKERVIPEIRTSDFLRQDGVFTFYDTPDELKGKGNYYLTDDDRIFWWDGTDEVIISDEMNSWIEELADQHGKLMDLSDAGCGDAFKGENFIKDFMILLYEICDRYKRIFPFKTMFYEFIQNSERKEYRAAIALLKKLDEENREEGKIINYAKWDWSMTSKNVTQNIARLRLKRYMSVMANKKVRKKYFKF